MSEKGLIHIYFGDGKGKTTAALGLALRAAGYGKNVVIVQFLKSWICGEHKSLPNLSNVTLIRGKTAGGKFIYDMNDEEKQTTKTWQEKSLNKALELVKKEQCDVLILDEAIDALKLGMLETTILKELINNKPNSLELVITGHNPDDWLLGKADYITEMVKHKHPYETGIQARKGIEY